MKTLEIICALVCFSFVYYMLANIKLKKQIASLQEENASMESEFNLFLKESETNKEELTNLLDITNYANKNLKDNLSKIESINNDLEQSNGRLSFQLKRQTNLAETLASNLAAAHAKLSVLSKNIDIPEKDLVEFLAKYKNKDTIKYYPSKFCLFCEKRTFEGKTFCNKEHQLAFQKNGFHSLNKTYTDEKM